MGLSSTAINSTPRRHSFDEQILTLQDSPIEVRTIVTDVLSFLTYISTVIAAVMFVTSDINEANHKSQTAFY